jgi:hypothetical protein
MSTGRLPPDQDATALPAVLGAGEQDVLPRPVTATDFAPSRRQSSAQSGGRPGTPDSDGFGFSEFEGVEPLVPPAAAAAQVRVPARLDSCVVWCCCGAGMNA